jgi:diguanylate cyclase (GGDEF)-like protein/PAS domain S-box-containing protein
MMVSEAEDGGGAKSGAEKIVEISAATGSADLLAMLEALLTLTGDTAAIAALARRARALFGCDHAVLLQEDGEALRAVASDPPGGAVRTWAASASLLQAVRTRVLALGSGEPDGDRALVPVSLVAAGEPALLLPIAVADGAAAVLLLRRRAGAPGCSAETVARARLCSVVSLAGLAMRNGQKAGHEIERLQALVAELAARERTLADDRDVFKTIIDLLPVSLTLQDEDGRFILVNAVAANNLGTAAQVLLGASPADFLPADEAAQRRDWEIGLMRSGAAVATEEHHPEAGGERIWLTSHKPVHVLDRYLLMSSSLDISDRKQIEDELARRAYFDDLTGLPNRLVIERRVDAAVARHDGATRFAVAFIDLDNFKHINDYYSHAVGDALLRKVAERIGRHLRPTDMLARISGDEFLLLVEPLESDEHIRALVDHLLVELKNPFHIETFEIFTSASLGISTFPEHGESYEALRRNADNAMYRAKNSTKGAAVYFDTTMSETLTARMELEQRLRLAIRDRKFCCAFQPKVDVQTQQVVGFETLVRWRDEGGEIQPPSAFIGLAIELGLIDPITHFVLEEAMASIERLDATFGAGTTISINVAAKQAGDLPFMRSLMAAIDQSRYARRLMIELTEDAFVAQSLFQTEVLPMIRERGVRVSIDDFGTGYSSLSALADITADELKVDRSFITGIHQRPRSQSVLRAIESLGHALGMSIVAEGVETFEELAYLQGATRIRQAQGFYFSKPFFLEDLAAMRDVQLDARPIESARPRATGRPSISARAAIGDERG